MSVILPGEYNDQGLAGLAGGRPIFTGQAGAIIENQALTYAEKRAMCAGSVFPYATTSETFVVASAGDQNLNEYQPLIHISRPDISGESLLEVRAFGAVFELRCSAYNTLDATLLSTLTVTQPDSGFFWASSSTTIDISDLTDGSDIYPVALYFEFRSLSARSCQIQQIQPSEAPITDPADLP